MKELTFSDIEQSYLRIKDHVKNTPLLTFEQFDQRFNAKLFFKMDCKQETGSFKERGAFNSILAFREIHGHLPKKIVIQSSGNHAQAVAKVAKGFGIEVLVYMIKESSKLKIQKARDLGAKVVLCDERSEANYLADQKAKQGYHFIHPASGEFTITGQGTACYEALKEIGEVDYIFAPCGGGGLVSGSYLATQGLAKNAKVYACEPLLGNDVALSFKKGEIVSFKTAPKTIADGARTLATTEQTFAIIKKLAGVLEISEEKIKYWANEFKKMTTHKIEPTSALAIAGVEQLFLADKLPKDAKILVIISGRNVMPNTT